MATKPTTTDLRYSLQLIREAIAKLELAQVVLTGENIEGALRRLHAHVEGLKYQIEVAELKARQASQPKPIDPETAP